VSLAVALILSWSGAFVAQYLGAVGAAIVAKRGFLPLHFAAVAGTSAYVFARLCAPAGPWLGAGAAIFAAVTLSMLLGLCFLRLRGVTAALGSMVFQVVFELYVRVAGWTGGSQGLWQGIPSPGPAVALAMHGALVLLGTLVFSAYGRSDSAIVNVGDGCAPEALAAPSATFRLRALSWANGLAGAAAGLAGIVIAIRVGFVSPALFTLSQALSLVAVVMLAGHERWGRIAVAAFVLALLPDLLRLAGLGEAESSAWRGVLLGLLLVVMAIAQAPRLGRVQA